MVGGFISAVKLLRQIERTSQQLKIRLIACLSQNRGSLLSLIQRLNFLSLQGNKATGSFFNWEPFIFGLATI